MSTVADAASIVESGVASIAASLERWYADHSSIRRLWAIEDPVALRVLVELEPTCDGDDSLPAWLANNRNWANDLRRRLRRDVQFQLVTPDTFGVFHVNHNAVMITVTWRNV